MGASSLLDIKFYKLQLTFHRPYGNSSQEMALEDEKDNYHRDGGIG